MENSHAFKQGTASCESDPISGGCYTLEQSEAVASGASSVPSPDSHGKVFDTHGRALPERETSHGVVLHQLCCLATAHLSAREKHLKRTLDISWVTASCFLLSFLPFSSSLGELQDQLNAMPMSSRSRRRVQPCVRNGENFSVRHGQEGSSRKRLKGLLKDSTKEEGAAKSEVGKTRFSLEP